jgi:CHAT domain-containing protein/tetratricopeptide (TPR) repeat protein
MIKALFWREIGKLAIGLLAVTSLLSPPLGHASYSLLAQAIEKQGKSSLPDLKSMAEQANKKYSEGNYADSAAIWQKILLIVERHFGPYHPNVALGLNNLAESLRAQGKYAEAEPHFRRALEINEKSLGFDHVDVATSLVNLAGLLRERGDYKAAIPLARRSLVIRVKALGPDHPDTASGLNALAAILDEQGNYEEALRLYRIALAIREKNLGSDHPDVATSLNNLAGVLREQGKYGAAEPLSRRALAIREKSLGSDHPEVATSLNNLAGVLSGQGQHGAAELLHRRALSIREKTFGLDHPEVASSLDNLAGVLRDQGKYGAAEPLSRQALAITEKTLGQDHPDVAVRINNLAGLLSLQGQYSASELLHGRALVIREKTYGADHPEVAVSLNNLAAVLRDQGKYTVAESLQRRVLIINEKTLGVDHPLIATSLNNLAGLLSLQGQYSAAELLHRRALPIREKTYGAEHSQVAISLNNLAGVLRDQGKYIEAESFQRRALAIQIKELGQEHITVAASLGNLAGLLNLQGQYSVEILTLKRSLAIESSWLIRELPLLPDQARSAQLRKLGHAWETTFGLINQYPPASHLALETRLSRQGLLAEIEKRQSFLLNNPGVDRAMVEKLRGLTQELASISLSADRRAALSEQRDKLQAELYRRIPDLQIQLVTSAEVAKALPADGVLVEFQRYQLFDGRKPKNQRWGEAHYIALVLKPDGSISAVPLGPAAAIDAQAHKGLSSSAQGQSDAEASWAQLSNQLLKPLLPQLSGSRQWFLSPDGELNRVPFAALPAPQETSKPLAQAVQLRLLTTGRELVRLQQSAPSGSAALVVANPDYERVSARGAAAPPPDASLVVAQRRSARVGSSKWKPLPGSEREGQQVAQLLSSRLISGPTATTTELLRQQGPRVLHIATHGFFVADQDSPTTNPLGVVQEKAPQLQALRGEDLQLRSGLVFAGANQPDLDPKDDGYLTAAEAVTLNLKGTELVVLSACSTGQGEERTGEGVYGLQRSLTVAGARSTLLSLWKVDDAATAEFMGRYYQRLKAGEGRSDALAAVQAEFRSGKVPSPSGANWKEPYFWAAWQLVGDWRPIKGL